MHTAIPVWYSENTFISALLKEIMTRRVEAKVGKYAYIQFLCDGKTLQTKSNQLQSNGNIAVGSEVSALWEGTRYKAKVIGLSDDLTQLNEVEREFERNLQRKAGIPNTSKPKAPSVPSKVVKKLNRPAVARKTSLLQNRGKSLKRKAEKGIEMIQVTAPAPRTSNPGTPLPPKRRAFDLSVLTEDQRTELASMTKDHPTRASMQAEAINPSTNSRKDPDIKDILLRIEDKLDRLSASPTPKQCDSSTQTEILPVCVPRPSLKTHVMTPPQSPSLPKPGSAGLQFFGSSTDYSQPARNIDKEPESLALIHVPVSLQLSTGIDAPLQQSTFESTPACTPASCKDPPTSPTSPTSEKSAESPEYNPPDLLTDNHQQELPITHDHRPDSIIHYHIQAQSSTSEQLLPDPSMPDFPATCNSVSVELLPPTKPIQTPPANHVDIQMNNVISSRFWLLKPSQLENSHVSPEKIIELTSVVLPAPTESLELDADQLVKLKNRSHSASHLAKNILFECFTLRELYQRNAMGKNFSGPHKEKKQAIDALKFKQLLDLVKLYYPGDVEKSVIISINNGLRHLWNRKLNYRWLPHLSQ